MPNRVLRATPAAVVRVAGVAVDVEDGEIVARLTLQRWLTKYDNRNLHLNNELHLLFDLAGIRPPRSVFLGGVAVTGYRPQVPGDPSSVILCEPAL